ncbi:MAG: twin-arginine translocase TatA/TatE family subunit [Candidatus Kapabacteria bacterium]|jgi:TatA/E family protein of Tat protein translocase|nr:twin-arginine translocase TatA/TatE family subunit [Candidatus Kapabacteria bacterium]
MFDVGGGELLLILLVVLMLFGPKKIPEFMQMLGKGIRQFKKAQEDLTEQIRDLSTVEPTVASTTPPVVVAPASVVPRTPPLTATNEASAPSDATADADADSAAPNPEH